MIVVLLSIAACVVAVYVAWMALVWRWQERIVFQPPSHAPAEPVVATRVDYTASDGGALFGYLVGDCTRGAPVVLAFHGNADLARWLVPWATSLSHATGACVMLAEYRGYDGAPGRPTYAASSLDADAALAYVRDRLGVPASRIVYFGHSLGTAIAAELASRQPPRALVLQSPFSSARAMAARMFLPGLLTVFWDRVSRVHFDTEARVSSLRAPVWVAHGDRDAVIPLRMGRAVFAAAAVKGELLVVRGAGHNDVAIVGGDEYWRWIASAIAPARDVSSRAATER